MRDGRSTPPTHRRTKTPHTTTCYQNTRVPGSGIKVNENTGIIPLRSDTNAAAAQRSVAAHVASLVMQELGRPARKMRLSANTKAKRHPVGITFMLPRKTERALKKRAKEDMRSLSGYVQVVIVEHVR